MRINCTPCAAYAKTLLSRPFAVPVPLSILRYVDVPQHSLVLQGKICLGEGDVMRGKIWGEGGRGVVS